MITFNKLVMSETEPLNTNDLWFRLDQDVPQSIWWFSPKGWQKLFDLDTRYNTEWLFEYESQADDPLETTEKHNPLTGVTKVVNTLHIYDATRDLENNWNLVNEIGLKWHVDDLQKKIDALTTRVTQNEQEITSLQSRVSDLEEDIDAAANRIASLENEKELMNARITTLENALQ